MALQRGDAISISSSSEVISLRLPTPSSSSASSVSSSDSSLTVIDLCGGSSDTSASCLRRVSATLDSSSLAPSAFYHPYSFSSSSEGESVDATSSCSHSSWFRRSVFLLLFSVDIVFDGEVDHGTSSCFCFRYITTDDQPFDQLWRQRLDLSVGSLNESSTDSHHPIYDRILIVVHLSRNRKLLPQLLFPSFELLASHKLSLSNLSPQLLLPTAVFLEMKQPQSISVSLPSLAEGTTRLNNQWKRASSICVRAIR